MSKVSLKKNLSSMQVLKTLQLLIEGNYTMQELVDMLNESEGAKIFNNSVISKYINTCRYCGVEIPKIQNRYFVATLPFGLNLDDIEVDMLCHIQEVIKDTMASKYHKIFSAFIAKLNKYSSKKILRVDKDTYNITYEYFEKAVSLHRKVKLMFKNRAEMICIPRKIDEIKGKMFFNVIHNDKNRLICTERLSGIQILTEKFIEPYGKDTVIFVLKGDLADRYILKENEKIVGFAESDGLAISTIGESKEALLSRLLRYDDKCEIKKPHSYREEMKKILDDTLKNYGVA